MACARRKNIKICVTNYNTFKTHIGHSFKKLIAVLMKRLSLAF